MPAVTRRITNLVWFKLSTQDSSQPSNVTFCSESSITLPLASKVADWRTSSPSAIEDNKFISKDQSIKFKNSKLKAKIDDSTIISNIKPNDLKDFGLIPEILGRLPVLTYMLELDANTLRNILTEPKNALTKQYIRLFEIDNIELTFTNQALDYIVEKAVEFKLGARGLRSICETILIDDMFNLPGSKTKKLIVDKSYIVSKLDDTNFTDLKEAS